MACKPCPNCGLTGTHHTETGDGKTVTALVHYDTEVGGETLGYCLRVESYEWGEHWRITRWIEGQATVRKSTLESTPKISGRGPVTASSPVHAPHR